MKNKEKYANEILDIACSGKTIAMDKNSKELVPCSCMSCKDCYFHPKNYPYRKSFTCKENVEHWCNSEYQKPKKKFTQKEKAFIRLCDKINWIAKNKDGYLWGYYKKPLRQEGWWASKEPKWPIKSITSLPFNSIQCEDDEPTSRDEILGVEND